jgi:hypothetical protein
LNEGIKKKKVFPLTFFRYTVKIFVLGLTIIAEIKDMTFLMS